MLGARIDRDYVMPVFIGLVALAALLFTYNWTMLIIGTLAYLALIPYGYFTYRRREARWRARQKRKNEEKARDTSGAKSHGAASGQSPSGEITPPPDRLH
jgi:CDP-diacylglycerol--serine O-phosphatidyltransferase